MRQIVQVPKTKYKILSILFFLFFLPFIASFTLDSTTVLNTTVSNSSITFSITITVSEVTVEPTYIYLTSVLYTQDGETHTCATLNHSEANTVLDSADFPCNGDEPEEPGAVGGNPTFSPSSEDLKEGYSKILLEGWKVSIPFNDNNYELEVEQIYEDKIKFSVESKVFELNINETKKIDLDGDNYYDLEVFIGSIDGARTQLEFKEIHEEVPTEEQEAQEEESKIGERKIKNWMWITGGAILLVIVVFVIWFFKTKYKRAKKEINLLKIAKGKK